MCRENIHQCSYYVRSQHKGKKALKFDIKKKNTRVIFLVDPNMFTLFFDTEDLAFWGTQTSRDSNCMWVRSARATKNEKLCDIQFQNNKFLLSDLKFYSFCDYGLHVMFVVSKNTEWDNCGRLPVCGSIVWRGTPPTESTQKVLGVAVPGTFGAKDLQIPRTCCP